MYIDYFYCIYPRIYNDPNHNAWIPLGMLFMTSPAFSAVVT